MRRTDAFEQIQREVIACDRCPRLRGYCARVARERRPLYRDWTYWGKPVPAFGRPPARLLVIGLAPAAHGANRTGRMFTGDSSGSWLYAALHRFGFATQPGSAARDDGLQLRDCVISAAARCAPPGNKPAPVELDRCRPFLVREIELLRPQLVVVLGRIAWEAWLRAAAQLGGTVPRPRPAFAHGQLVRLPGLPPVLQSYHPSRQNTNTGKLTRAMWNAVFAQARALVDAQEGAGGPGPVSAERARRRSPAPASPPASKRPRRA
jgi:uracil-DNA glycosylase family 4